jgi:hypothetical protein
MKHAKIGEEQKKEEREREREKKKVRSSDRFIVYPSFIARL